MESRLQDHIYSHPVIRKNRLNTFKLAYLADLTGQQIIGVCDQTQSPLTTATVGIISQSLPLKSPYQCLVKQW